MSKFKVGDKVETPFGIGEIIVFNYFLEKDKSYKVRLNYKMDDTHAYEYGKTPLLNFTEKELELYKTPHERLLDLGFELALEDDEQRKYISANNLNRIIIDVKMKEYKFYFKTNIAVSIDLELAEILVDYLKELQDE